MVRSGKNITAAEKDWVGSGLGPYNADVSVHDHGATCVDVVGTARLGKALRGFRGFGGHGACVVMVESWWLSGEQSFRLKYRGRKEYKWQLFELSKDINHAANSWLCLLVLCADIICR